MNRYTRKEQFIEALAELLRTTGGYSDIEQARLELRGNKEYVVIDMTDGDTINVNVTLNSILQTMIDVGTALK